MSNFKEMPNDSMENKTDENQENIEQSDLNLEEVNILQNKSENKTISQAEDIVQREEEDKEKIREIQEQLGLPTEESKEPSISSEKPVENNKNKEIDEIIINKEKIADLIDAGRKLVYTFHKREENGFNPLIEEEYISPLATSLNSLNTLIEDTGQAIDIKEFNNAIIKVTNRMNNIGNVPRAQSMSDNVESLGKIIFCLQEMVEKAHNIALSLSGEKEERPEEVLKILHELEDTTRKKWLFVARKREALSQYRS